MRRALDQLRHRESFGDEPRIELGAARPRDARTHATVTQLGLGAPRDLAQTLERLLGTIQLDLEPALVGPEELRHLGLDQTSAAVQDPDSVAESLDLGELMAREDDG